MNAATTKASLNKFLNDYVINVTRNKCILSDNGIHLVVKLKKKQIGG